MFAKINHVAIVSENYAQLGNFYSSVFGMKLGKSRPGRAITVGDRCGSVHRADPRVRPALRSACRLPGISCPCARVEHGIR